MSFVQPPPQLRNQYDDDRVLRSYLHRTLPPDFAAGIEPGLRNMGALAGGALYKQQLAEREIEPLLVRWDAWGNRIDRIEVTPLWRTAERLAAERGLVAIAYAREAGALSRVQQFALAYLFTPSTDLYSCPLAMTDGAACALLASGNQVLIDRAVPRLTSRNPERFWTSGQWMTEATGGSDVGLSETVARQEGGAWRLYGRKWFTSAIASQMALTLARPEGNPPGGKGLALFYVETHDERGLPNGIRIERLKDKLGTRKVPTAELTLDGTPAALVAGTADGVRSIAPMLNITRTWNSVSAVALMRRGIALARDYARRRVVFGAALAEKPLHLDTLAGLQAEYETAFHLTFFVVELLGRCEAGEASAQQSELLRILTPVAKLTTGRQSVTVLSEVIEAFGGAGYVEDTGLPVLLRDAQVLPIWEGTTNVLALDMLRAIEGAGGLSVVEREVHFILQGVRHADLLRISARVEHTLEQVRTWLASAMSTGATAVEAGARRAALTAGRAFALALLARQAQWSFEHERDERPLAAARRFAAAGISLLGDYDSADARRLARDESYPSGGRKLAGSPRTRGEGDWQQEDCMIEATMMDFPLTLHHVLERAGRLFGTSEIVSRLPDKSLHRYAYRDFHARTLALAGALQRLGLKPGDRVATLMWNHYAHLEAYLAVPCAGGVVHTLNLRLHPDDIAYIANHAGDRFLIVDDVLLPLLEKFRDTARFEQVIVVPLSGKAVTAGLDYEALIAERRPFTAGKADENAPAAMCYTSGTTGRPKGVVYSHRSIVLHTLATATADYLGVSNRDTVCPVVPMFHVNAWGLPYTALLMGANLAMPGPHLDAVNLLDLYASERVTVSAGVPTIWLGIQQALEREPERWKLVPGMRMVVGGAAAPEALIRGLDRFGLRVIHGWGMTETSPVGAINFAKRGAEQERDDAGYALRAKQGVPLPYFEVRAVGESGEAPWDGSTMGELQVRGPWVAAGYHDLPDAREQWTADGWFRTGDIVTIDEAGYVKITDRAKDLIKSGGEWISSIDLENALLLHPAVQEAAVIGVPHPKWDERPLGVIVVKPGAEVTPEALTAHLASRFAKYTLPDAYVYVAEIPRTSTGKMLKATLRETYKDWKWT